MSCGGNPNSERPKMNEARSGLLPAWARIACTSRQARWIVVEKQGVPARRLEQQIDGAHAARDRLARIPAIAGARGERDFLTGTGATHHFGKNRQHPLARRVDLGRRLGKAELDKRVFDGARAVADIDSPQGLLAKRGERTLRGADCRRYD